MTVHNVVRALRGLTRIVRRLRTEKRGNVLMMFGISLVPMCFAVAMTIDYSRSQASQTRLNAITDAAALAAIAPAMLSKTPLQSAQAAVNMWYGQAGLTQCSGATVNRVIFRSCAVPGYGSSTSATSFTGYDGTLRVTVTDTTNANGMLKRTITISYSAQSQNIFAKVLGSNTLPISGTTTSAGSPPTYINYYILLDISQSMGIGATQADMANLFARTAAYGNGGCVFGCHVTTGGQSRTNEDLAHNVSPRITLRIDSAVSAVQNIIADAQTVAGTSGTVKIGLYTMSDNPVSGTKFTVVTAPSSNYSDLTSKAATITLGNNNSNGAGDTNYAAQMPLFNAQIPANGTGLTASSPKNYVFIVTDGVTDTASSSCLPTGHCTAPFDPANCTPLKAKATVGTIYTTYLPIYNNNNSNQGFEAAYGLLVWPFGSQIAPNMKSCATSASYYYEATDGPALNAAMKALFAATVQSSRLTQ